MPSDDSGVNRTGALNLRARCPSPYPAGNRSRGLLDYRRQRTKGLASSGDLLDPIRRSDVWKRAATRDLLGRLRRAGRRREANFIDLTAPHWGPAAPSPASTRHQPSDVPPRRGSGHRLGLQQWVPGI